MVPPEDFQKLADLEAVQFVWASHHDPNETMIQTSRACADMINQYGGNAEVLMLEQDLGIKGASHIPFADMDNARIAGFLEKFLQKNGLDSYSESWWRRLFR
jgi:hypothetical protein